MTDALEIVRHLFLVPQYCLCSIIVSHFNNQFRVAFLVDLLFLHEPQIVVSIWSELLSSDLVMQSDGTNKLFINPYFRFQFLE
jgi:hypothetical protein